MPPSGATAGIAPVTLGSVDSDGYLVVVGRAKDVIIRGGQNISPKEIEDLVGRIPRWSALA